MNGLPKSRYRLLLALALVNFGSGRALAQSGRDTLAGTPPMGWNSWNKFACNVSEDLIKSVADAMATNGLKEAGYQYVVIEDCWQVSRDESVPDPARFGTVASHAVVMVKITP